jgi:hypothetical protein
MAGLPWFKVATDFPGHPKTLRLCALLGDPNAGMYVVRLLAYCAAYASDGRVPLDMLAHAAGWKRQRVAPEFLASSLETAGFLVCTETHAEIHGWDEWNGAHVRKCAKDNARPRSDYRVPRAGTSRDLGGNLSGSRAGDVEGEVDREKKKLLLLPDAQRAPVEEPPEGVSPATPPAQANGAAGSPAHPKPKRTAAPRAEKTPDPRHRPLQLALEAAYREVRGSGYGFHKRDARAIAALLVLSGGDIEETVRRFRVGLVSDFKERVDCIWELEAKWNALSRTNGAAGVQQPREFLT